MSFLSLILLFVSVISQNEASAELCAPATPYSGADPRTWPLINGSRIKEATPGAAQLDDRAQLDTFDSNVADFIARKHNCLRSLVAPLATNMLKISWNTAARDRAQAWANDCNFSHNDATIPGWDYCGQNIAAGTGKLTWNAVNDMWYDEGKDYVYGGTSSGATGHYTQVVWAKTDQVGCGWKSCPAAGSPFGRAWNFYVCNYCTGGNFNNELPYRTGAASCSACPPGTACEGGKLCSPGGNISNRKSQSTNGLKNGPLTTSSSRRTHKWATDDLIESTDHHSAIYRHDQSPSHSMLVVLKQGTLPLSSSKKK
ncbi:putative Cysteine-rich venom protein kaouthin-1 [Hypsibius exemplaris]|uniref:Cysteine-rich venom protein kaouthin-1 n=1 Tax=Hypsibius exemplaris TaxID=2072580 RepID=A0A1W0WEL8_HYPEX|nr:putative Cysteine-rich venom protein kaouthin-1 [Hypsibius exemplaris]